MDIFSELKSIAEEMTLDKLDEQRGFKNKATASKGGSRSGQNRWDDAYRKLNVELEKAKKAGDTKKVELLNKKKDDMLDKKYPMGEGADVKEQDDLSQYSDKYKYRDKDGVIRVKPGSPKMKDNKTYKKPTVKGKQPSDSLMMKYRSRQRMTPHVGGHPANYRESIEEQLKLWKYNPVTGLWKVERTVTPETKDKWLKIFKDDEPKSKFVVSKNKPTQKMSMKEQVQTMVSEASQALINKIRELSGGRVPTGAAFRELKKRAQEELKKEKTQKKAEPKKEKEVSKTSKGKTYTGSADPSDKNIIMQLRKAQDVDGNMDIRISPERTTRLKKSQIDTLLKQHDAITKPRDKRMFIAKLTQALRKK